MICLLAPLSLFYIQPAEAEGENWWDTDWSYRKLVTLDSSQIEGSHNNFPVLLNISSDSDLSSHMGQADAGDVVFIDHDDNSTKYYHEIEYYGSGTLVAHVRVNDTTHTKFWLYYGNAGCADQWDADNTWDSDFFAVYHGRTTSDSSGNGYTLTNGGVNLDDNEGAFSGCFDFNIDDTDYMKQATLLDGGTDFSITMYMYPKELGADAGDSNEDYFWYKRNSVGDRVFSQWKGSTGKTFSRVKTDTATFTIEDFDGTLAANGWHYCSWCLDDGTTWKNSVDNEYIDAGSITDTWDSGSQYDFFFGASYVPSKKYGGLMDEIRVYSICLSDNWVKTERNNFVNATTGVNGFYSLDSEEGGSGGWTNSAPSFSEVSPVNESTAQGRGKTLSVKVTDADGNQSTCDFYTSLNGVDWTHRQTNTTVLNETIQYVFSSATSFNTLYYWKITANDTHDNSTAIYEYTTRVEYLISSDGIQEYLNKPCGWHYEGTYNRTYFTYTDGDGSSSYLIRYFDHDTDEFSSETNLGNYGSEDDHVAPTIAINQSGYIFVFISGHSDNTMQVRRSTNPESISSFQSAVNIDTTGTTTYPKPWVMENDTIAVSYRDTSTSPDHQDIAFSTDSGASWTVKQLTDSGSFAMQYCEQTDTDYVHFVYTDPVDTTGDRTDLYYAYSDDGGYTWYDSDDTEIAWPLNYANMTKCWQENQCRQLDLYAGSDHNAHILANADLGNSNATIPLYHIWYDGSSWHNESMPVWQSVFRHHDTHNYTNGGCFDRKNPNVVYTAGYDGENIDLAVYTRSGGSWSKARVDVNDAPPSGNTIIVRPMPIRYYYNMSYTYAKGTYSMYNSYSTTYYYGYEYSIDNNLPQLSSNSVYPTSGVASYTVFQFNITWTDADGEDPTDGYLKVNISKVGWNTNQSMSWVSGSNSTGAVYTYSTTLTAGEYSYTFYAYDGIDYDSSGAHSDPSVTAQDISFTIETSSETGDFEFINWTITSPGAGSTTEYNVSEDNQTDGTSACTITNTGNVPLNFSLMWLTDPGEGITLKYSLTNTAPNPGVNSIAVSPSETQIITDLATSSSQDVWLWIDFVSVSSQEDDADVRFTSEIYETG